MRMVEVKVAELEGAALDWAVANAAGRDVSILINGAVVCGDRVEGGCPWRPSTDWAQCGPLIERRLISLHSPCSSQGNTGHEGWNANCPVVDDPDFTAHEHWRWQAGATPLIAACRAIAAAKHGDTISIPAELVDS